MPKFKPAKGKPKKAASAKGAIPCVILIILGMVLFSVLFYMVMAPAGQK